MKNFLNKIKNALIRFMYGRYGVDQLNKVLMYASIILLIISCFITNLKVRGVFFVLAWAIIIYTYFRMFSKNIAKRYSENAWFTGKMNYLKTRIKGAKEYRFFDCPNCHAHLRVPRGVGKITITCKKCGTKFDRKA